MVDPEEYYYKLTVYLLSTIGLWPSASTTFHRIQKFCWGFIVIFNLMCQLTPFITMQYSTTLVLHNAPVIIVGLGTILKYFTFLVQSDDVKMITELVKHDWDTTKDDEESKILMHHASLGKSYTTAFAKFLYPSLILWLLSLYMPWFLDLVIPLNETRSRQFFITFDVFIDQQKYFHIVVLGFGVDIFTVGTVYLATESVYMMWQQHQSSQFEIYAYRVRKAFLGNFFEKDISNKNARVMTIFASALNMHDRAILFNTYLSKFGWSYFFLLGFGVTSLSVFLYSLSEVLKTLDELHELLFYVTLIIVEFAYIYYMNYMMQQVLDSYDNISVATYDTNWYAAPVRAQKMLLFVMLRNMRALNNKMCGMVDMSLEGFTGHAKVVISYFMMIRSIQ